MKLEEVAQFLGWPPADHICNPARSGPKHHAQTVKQKIGRVLERSNKDLVVSTGILVSDASDETGSAPIAVVCQFNRPVTDDVLREAQRLCWNLSYTALLITLEPHRLQAWTCSLTPKRKESLNRLRVLPAINFSETDPIANQFQNEIAQTLHWINLASGNLLREKKTKFRKEGRADAVLVSNLRQVRKLLIAKGLNREICHSLLARLIFTQFLFQRTDSEGRPAISQSVLDGKLDGQLKNVYEHAQALEQILKSKEETYTLFRWLNKKFNGDLFPGKGKTEIEREAEWKLEKDAVDKSHLAILSDFVSGKLDQESGQQSFWPEYSFDTLPLEFISSVYEEFLNEDQGLASAYYTPPHLVDFVLDGVLPWSGTQWDMKILDPCCGSGIFLVKAFQRLVQRWKNDHDPDVEPGVADLRGLLEKNLMGIDSNGEALRVASFSLCLALCDAIDPKQYWKQTLFPCLRDVRLIKSDFFAEDKAGFKTIDDGKTWDLVVGNAPWRDGALNENSDGMTWATKNSWPVADKNPGPLFVAKAAALTNESGRVSMILPAATMLYQRSSAPALEYRRKFFSTFTVEEVVSFAHLRWQLFSKAKSSACLITLQPVEPKPDTAVAYIAPKPQFSFEDESVIIIDPQDIHELSHEEAAEYPLVWIVLLSGSRRDLMLIRRLGSEMTLRKLRAERKESATSGQVLLTREGIIRGKSNQRDEPQILGRRILDNPNFPNQDSHELVAEKLKINKDSKIRSPKDFSAFEMPQLIIKQSIIKSIGRFQTRIVQAKSTQGIICTQSYLSVHQFDGNDGWLRSACLALQSRVTAYYLVLTSCLAFDRGTTLAGDMLDVPIPSPELFPATNSIDLQTVDFITEKAFGLKESESALISDMLNFVYREGGSKHTDRPSRKQTHRESDETPDDLVAYTEFLVKSLRSNFGNDKAIRATIYTETNPADLLPVRMVALYLNWPSRRQVIVKEKIEKSALRAEMTKLYREQLSVRSRDGTVITSGLGFQRVARLFITHKTEKGEKIPTVLFLKPDQRRYWTRSQALRDADELVASIMAAGQRRRSKA